MYQQRNSSVMRMRKRKRKRSRMVLVAIRPPAPRHTGADEANLARRLFAHQELEAVDVLQRNAVPRATARSGSLGNVYRKLGLDAHALIQPAQQRTTTCHVDTGLVKCRRSALVVCFPGRPGMASSILLMLLSSACAISE